METDNSSKIPSKGHEQITPVGKIQVSHRARVTEIAALNKPPEPHESRAAYYRHVIPQLQELQYSLEQNRQARRNSQKLPHPNLPVLWDEGAEVLFMAGRVGLATREVKEILGYN